MKEEFTEEQKDFYLYVHSLIGHYVEQKGGVGFQDIVEVLETVHDEQVERMLRNQEHEEMLSTFSDMINQNFEARD